MKQIRYAKQFKKDLKRFLNKPAKLEKLAHILDLLKTGIPIPKEYKPHPLKGEYYGCTECHIEDDFLLIWYDERTDTIVIYRLGTHAGRYGGTYAH